ncbi:MAG TPA: penicillin-binding protein 2, partial [Chloroflexota bacterium]|nr:penicillin-binding protein 2 [Chloroflexota bacterium]
MNRALRRISIAVLVMFVLLLVNVNYLQGFEPASLASKPNNARAFEAQFQYQRGNIQTSDGVIIAKSTPSTDVYKYQRQYPRGPEYAPVTGYDTLYSETGIEQYENAVLNGSDSSLTVRNFIDLLTGKPRKGANVTLTINARAQDAAWNALENDTNGKPGAVVALNPQTGQILALASYPSYDPNVLATHDSKKLIAADNALLKQPSNPLL